MSSLRPWNSTTPISGRNSMAGERAARWRAATSPVQRGQHPVELDGFQLPRPAQTPTGGADHGGELRVGGQAVDRDRGEPITGIAAPFIDDDHRDQQAVGEHPRPAQPAPRRRLSAAGRHRAGDRQVIAAGHPPAARVDLRADLIRIADPLRAHQGAGKPRRLTRHPRPPAGEPAPPQRGQPRRPPTGSERGLGQPRRAPAAPG